MLKLLLLTLTTLSIPSSSYKARRLLLGDVNAGNTAADTAANAAANPAEQSEQSFPPNQGEQVVQPFPPNQVEQSVQPFPLNQTEPLVQLFSPMIDKLELQIQKLRRQDEAKYFEAIQRLKNVISEMEPLPKGWEKRRHASGPPFYVFKTRKKPKLWKKYKNNDEYIYYNTQTHQEQTKMPDDFKAFIDIASTPAWEQTEGVDGTIYDKAQFHKPYKT